MTQDVFSKIIDVFVPSEVMSTYLKTLSPDSVDICALIFDSPQDIYEKLKWYEILLDEKEMLEDQLKCVEYYDAVKDAIAELEGEDGVFTIEAHYYSDMEKINDWWPILYADFGKVFDAIQHEIECDEADFGEVGRSSNIEWFTAHKFVPNTITKEYDRVYIYYVIKGKVCFFDKLITKVIDGEKWEIPDKSTLLLKRRVVLPTPFYPGDIVKIANNAPFPCFYGVILEESKLDSAYPTVLVKSEKRTWETGSLTSNSCIARKYPASPIEMYFSSLFTIEYVNLYDKDFDTPEKDVLRQVSDYLFMDKKRGKKLWNYIFESRDVTDEMLLSFIGKDETETLLEGNRI